MLGVPLFFFPLLSTFSTPNISMSSGAMYLSEALRSVVNPFMLRIFEQPKSVMSGLKSSDIRTLA